MRRNVSRVLGGLLASKALAFVREVITAALFGTGAVVASFRVALAGTFVPAHFLASDAVNSAFIPVYKELRADSRDKAQILVWALMVMFGAFSLGIGALFWFASAHWVRILTPGLDAKTTLIASAVLSVMGLGVPCYLLTLFLMYLAAADDDFTPIAVRPVVQNLGLIAGTAAAFEFDDPALFAWGFAASYALLAAWTAIRATRSDLLRIPDAVSASDVSAALSAFWKALSPLLPLPIFLQGTIVVERVVASLVSLVAVSAIDYARFLSDTLITIISMPVGFAGLNQWSGLEAGAVRAHLSRLIPFVLLVAVPMSAFVAGNASLVVRITFARGAFDAQSVDVTTRILVPIALGLWAQIVANILIRALNALRRNHQVLRIMALSLVGNAAVDALGYSRFGATALGMGNLIYGVGLLIGAANALGMVGQVARRGGLLVLGGAIYVAIAWSFVLPERSVWGQAAQAVVVAAVFWTVWIAAIPDLRRLARRFVIGAE